MSPSAPPSPPPPPDDDPHSQYLFGPLLGTGTNGTVRTCVSLPPLLPPHPLVPLACKTVSLSSGASSALREISALRSLPPHPSIVRLLSVHVSPPSVHLLLELCPGGDLLHALRSTGRVTERHALHVARQLAEALSHCHRHGLCHRDVKLENVLLAGRNPDGRPKIKLADFGLAAEIRTGPQENVGSPLYLSPEAILGRTAPGGPRDIWATGIVLYALLAGNLPYKGKDPKAVLADIMRTDEVCTDGVAWEGVSVETRRLVRRMLAREWRERPTAKEVVEEISGRGAKGVYGGSDGGKKSINGAVGSGDGKEGNWAKKVEGVEGGVKGERVGRVGVKGGGGVVTVRTDMAPCRVAVSDERATWRQERGNGAMSALRRYLWLGSRRTNLSGQTDVS